MSFTNTLGTICSGFARMAGHAIASPFSRPARIKFLEASREHFHVYLRTPHLARIAAHELIDSSEEIVLQQYIRGRWQVTMVELTVIASLVRKRSPESIFEIGTFDGRTTLNLWLNRPEASMHTIDLPAGSPGAPDGKTPGMLIQDKVKDGKIEQIFGNTLEFDFSPWFGAQDYVFVDAGHGYQNAISDSRTALRLVEGREGVVVWHDYAVMPGVTQAVEEIMSEVVSEVDFVWVEDTSLAIMIPKTGHPIKLSNGLSGLKSAKVEVASGV
ncbi:hypothetical protein VDG1235_3599 [Verrucomicrobiia bacterium DG1235]|nr:hypothetical protein VDG1235_3599 [Verrucomicrobiae bacterium DG1235]